MSCGKPHETPCTEVLAELYAYLDEEIDPPGRAKIRLHRGRRQLRELLQDYAADSGLVRVAPDADQEPSRAESGPGEDET